MKACQLPCYIVHRRPFRETSLIIDVVAEHYGRLSVVLKGAQSSGKNSKRSALSAMAQPFRPLLMDIGGKGELKTTFGLEANGSVIGLSDKFLYSGFYLNELLCRLWPQNVDSDQLYRHYHQTLLALGEAQTLAEPNNLVLEMILRRFEFELLSLLGFEVDCGYSADNSQAIASELHYTFNPELGFSLTGLPLGRRGQLMVFSGADIIAIGDHRFSDAKVLKAAKILSRLALAPHLGSKPLKSRELFL